MNRSLQIERDHDELPAKIAKMLALFEREIDPRVESDAIFVLRKLADLTGFATRVSERRFH
jgi:hypothetical protein